MWIFMQLHFGHSKLNCVAAYHCAVVLLISEHLVMKNIGMSHLSSQTT